MPNPLFIETGSLPGQGLCQIRPDDWPASLRDPSGSTSPVLGLQARATMPSFFCDMGFWGWHLGPCVYKASTFPTVSTDPSIAFYFFKKCFHPVLKNAASAWCMDRLCIELACILWVQVSDFCGITVTKLLHWLRPHQAYPGALRCLRYPEPPAEFKLLQTGAWIMLQKVGHSRALSRQNWISACV